MGLYENVKNAAKDKGYSINRLEKELLWSSFFVTLRPNFCHKVYTTP